MVYRYLYRPGFFLNKTQTEALVVVESGSLGTDPAFLRKTITDRSSRLSTSTPTNRWPMPLAVFAVKEKLLMISRNGWECAVW